jgi:hypothetical protein
MAVYSGMTYEQIAQLARKIAEQQGMNLEHGVAVGFFDEAALQVAMDTSEPDRISSATWTESAIAMITGGFLYPERVFGDTTPLVCIEYEKFREIFLGDSSLKASNDTNVYYTILGTSIYLEPDISDFTNYVIYYSPRITTWATKSGVSSIPELPMEYRILISYKICELVFGEQFAVMYIDQLRDKRAHKNRKLSRGMAKWYDPFEGKDAQRYNVFPIDVTADD